MSQKELVSRRASLSYRLTVASWAGLLCYQIYCVANFGEPWIIALGRLLPLIIFIPGLIRVAPRTVIWLCFVSLMYFISGVERLFATPYSVSAWFAMVCIVTLFTAGMLWVRWQSRDQLAS